jgi:membrane protease YdiL (CAAX protease family)
MTPPNETRRNVVTFLILTLALSSIFYYLIISAGTLGAGSGLFVLGLMWCPGIAAIITRLAYQKNLRGMGWGWGKTRYQALSYLLPIGYALVAYGIVWLVGLGGISRGFSVNPLRFVALGTLMSCLYALGEEIGWRGLLVPELAKLTSFRNTSLLSGIIWSVWHYPVLLFADYNAGTPAVYGLLCFTIMVVGISFAFAWIRLVAGSVWTAMFLHASHNLYIQGFFDQVTTDVGITEYITGEFGAALAIISLVVAYWFWRVRARTQHAEHKAYIL